jgi:hypothetical protein
VWIDWPAYFRPEWVTAYEALGLEAWLRRERIEEEAARWRDVLGEERVKSGREWFYGRVTPQQRLARLTRSAVPASS